ncbi:unnamed protein product [Durusdinium trenchii]|uniref:Uncharacterized protein n=1 Tax=Durusdinium trenchii TaxID=1381693 RepID=A0ABP0JGU9_9DINO
MWYHLIALQLVATADVISDPCMGQCLSEEVGARVINDDHSTPAIGLMQTFLHYKLRGQSFGKAEGTTVTAVPSFNLTFAGVDPSNPYRLRSLADGCPLSKDLGFEVPFTIKTTAQIQAFRELGFIRSLPHCGWTSLTSISKYFAIGDTLDRNNSLARNICLGWGAVSITLMLWSFISVYRVPRKGTTDTVKTGLADEMKAYQRGVFNYMSLGWVDELVGRYGKCSHAVIDDNEIVVNRQDENFEPYVLFKKNWEEEVKRAGSVEKAWILRALYHTIGGRAVALLCVLALIEQLSSGVVMVIGLTMFLNCLEELDTYRLTHPGEPIDFLSPVILTLVWIWGSPMIFRGSGIIACLVDGHYTQICASGLASIVFHKALRTPAGQVKSERDVVNDDEEVDPLGLHKPNLVQLLNVDIVDCWGGLVAETFGTITAPISAIILLVIMIHQVGDASATVGATYVVPVMLLSTIFARFGMHFWRKYQICLDKRMKWLTETLISIRTVKALAWERLSYERLMEARDGELKNARTIIMLSGIITAIGHTVPWGVMIITIWFAERNGPVEAHKIMIIQRVIGALLGNIAQLSAGLTRLMTVPNSFNRIKRFLAQPDRPNNVVRQPSLQNQNAPALRVTGSFTYGGTKPNLKNLDVAIPKGELVGVIGRVGSGKTTFLQTIIGELYPIENSFVEAPDASSGNVAYCSQVPWIFEGTLRENIVTKSAMHHDRYYSCISAAGLAPDLQILPGGDQVTIGSFGIRLSGGQRARVALARAAYMEAANLVLMDDPFASVDGPTGQHIFNELILGSVMRGRTRIVVTQPDKIRLQHFDRVLLFEDGCIVAMGPPAEVMETESFKRIQAQVDEEEVQVLAKGSSPALAPRMDVALAVKEANEAGMLLREEEVREDITWPTFWWWVKTAGYTNLFVVLCAIILQAVVELRESLVIAVWVDSKVTQANTSDSIFMTRVIVVVLCCCVCISITYISVSVTALAAARRIHDEVISRLLKAPVDRFYDKHPVGRLINRLSFDMKQVDETFVTTLFGLLQLFIGMVTTNLFVLSVMPRFVSVCSFPIYALTLYFVYLYRGTAVPLVFHSKHCLSSLQDLQAVVVTQCISIRANGMMDSFMSRYNHYSHSVIRSQNLIYYICRAWAQSRVFLCFGVLTGYFALSGLWYGVPMGLLATCVSFSVFQMSSFEGLCLSFTHFLNVLNALQRLAKYTQVPEEAASDNPMDFSVLKRSKIRRDELVPLQMRAEGKIAGESTDSASLRICVRGGKPLLRLGADGRHLEFLDGCTPEDLAPGCKALQGLEGTFQIVAVNSLSTSAEQMARELCTPPAVIWVDFWNSDFKEGLSVEIEDLTAGYGTAKSVLHGVSLSIVPRTKCAFVGKTGCGKSTTLLCLLRFLEPRRGKLLIGGHDTSKLGLNAVRSMVGLVPQDPTVFEGTIRFNIDPFDEFPDARLWEAVQSVQLMPYIRTLPEGIDTHIERDGSNISFGQKQLLSLARMVVRQPPVLLLDECTSALDPLTQEAVQKTILKDFPRTTTIAVAHRLETIMSFDQIVVFDEGKVVENGTVDKLRKADGLFTAMLRAKGMK